MTTDRERVYGIPVAAFYRMWDEQNGQCAICFDSLIPRGRSSKSVVVDHDHKTQVVRGLLCNDCNTGLGKFGDDPDRLITASTYLTSHRLRRAG